MKVTVQNEATSALISALSKYRESARSAGRKRLAKWADRTIARIAGYLHVTEDLRMQDAIAAFHRAGVASIPVGEDLLRGFRTLLTDHELDALLDATVQESGN